MSTGATIKAKIEAAVAAQETGDYDGALRYMRSARMLMTGMPKIGHGEDRVEYNLADIDLMIQDLERLSAAAVGIQSIPFEYKRPSR